MGKTFIILIICFTIISFLWTVFASVQQFFVSIINEVLYLSGKKKAEPKKPSGRIEDYDKSLFSFPEEKGPVPEVETQPPVPTQAPTPVPEPKPEPKPEPMPEQKPEKKPLPNSSFSTSDNEVPPPGKLYDKKKEDLESEKVPDDADVIYDEDVRQDGEEYFRRQKEEEERMKEQLQMSNY